VVAVALIEPLQLPAFMLGIIGVMCALGWALWWLCGVAARACLRAARWGGGCLSFVLFWCAGGWFYLLGKFLALPYVTARGITGWVGRELDVHLLEGDLVNRVWAKYLVPAQHSPLSKWFAFQSAAFIGLQLFVPLDLCTWLLRIAFWVLVYWHVWPLPVGWGPVSPFWWLLAMLLQLPGARYVLLTWDPPLFCCTADSGYLPYYLGIWKCVLCHWASWFSLLLFLLGMKSRDLGMRLQVKPSFTVGKWADQVAAELNLPVELVCECANRFLFKQRTMLNMRDFRTYALGLMIDAKLTQRVIADALPGLLSLLAIAAPGELVMRTQLSRADYVQAMFDSHALALGTLRTVQGGQVREYALPKA